MTRTLRSLRRSRGLLAAHPVVWFLLGVLFAGQLPGEPLHSRLFLALLIVGAVCAGIVIEATRKGGTLALLDRLEWAPIEMSPDDRRMLNSLLLYVADHGGGAWAFPECDERCVSCQAAHLHDRLAGAA